MLLAFAAVAPHAAPTIFDAPAHFVGLHRAAAYVALQERPACSSFFAWWCHDDKTPLAFITSPWYSPPAPLHLVPSPSPSVDQLVLVS